MFDDKRIRRYGKDKRSSKTNDSMNTGEIRLKVDVYSK